MKRFVILMLALCLMLSACGAQEPPVPTEAPTKAPTVIQTEAPTEVPAPEADIPMTLPLFTVAPLPATVDINALDNCTVAISLEEGDIHGNEMTVTVYTYELYDLVDITRLGTGDTIIIRGQEVVVEALERTEGGLVLINGGMELGGYDLWTDEDTVYYETGYSDMKYWQALGQVTLEVSPDFVFTDSSDPEKDPVTYTFGNLTAENPAIDFHFEPQNTTISVENGCVTSMKRIYTP